MAQRTAFLNSDAKGYNKDFHHTWINNYMIKQPGVMFSNYSTKPEFALGNGQIAGGKAIIRCTRTTGTFAGSEILACFESTTTENISTSGNKKIYIEIPEVYVNDSTSITDALTGGANLGVGRIVSADSYPAHSNYIKLWEVIGGDWQNATDLRPEVLRRGKPNTISYFGGNGEEERINIDNNSLNKYLMSNGAGVAPSWEEGGGGGGGGSGENFKRTFTADEDLLAKSMFGVEVQAGTSAVDSSLDFGTTTATKVFFPVILNGESFDSLILNLASINSPADSLSIRIETLNNNGQPTGTLVNVGAYGTATPTSTATDITISLSGIISGLTAHTKAAVVIERSGSSSNSNYYKLGCLNASKVISQIYKYNGSTYSAVSYSGCVDCDGFSNDAVIQSTSLNGVDWVGYCETGATAGNDFTGILQGTVDYVGIKAGDKYYISNDGTLTTVNTSLYVGQCIANGVLLLGGGDNIETLNSDANIWELEEGIYVTDYDLYYTTGNKVRFYTAGGGSGRQMLFVVNQSGRGNAFFVYNVGHNSQYTQTRCSYGYSKSSSEGETHLLREWDASLQEYAIVPGQTNIDAIGSGGGLGFTQLINDADDNQSLRVAGTVYSGVTYTIIINSVASGQTYSVTLGTGVTNPLNIALPSSSNKKCIITMIATSSTTAIVSGCTIGS